MIEKSLKDWNKKLKLGNIQLGVAFKEVDKIPFSSCRLNYMLYGGIPVGRIAEFSGSDGSGKTTTALDLACDELSKVVCCTHDWTYEKSYGILPEPDYDLSNRWKRFFINNADAPDDYEIVQEIYDTIKGTIIEMGYNNVGRHKQSRIEKARIDITNHWLDVIEKICKKHGIDVDDGNRKVVEQATTIQSLNSD